MSATLKHPIAPDKRGAHSLHRRIGRDYDLHYRHEGREIKMLWYALSAAWIRADFWRDHPGVACKVVRRSTNARGERLPAKDA
jgi:hypothetical protein